MRGFDRFITVSAVTLVGTILSAMFLEIAAKSGSLDDIANSLGYETTTVTGYEIVEHSEMIPVPTSRENEAVHQIFRIAKYTAFALIGLGLVADRIRARRA